MMVLAQAAQISFQSGTTYLQGVCEGESNFAYAAANKNYNTNQLTLGDFLVVFFFKGKKRLIG